MAVDSDIELSALLNLILHCCFGLFNRPSMLDNEYIGNDRYEEFEGQLLHLVATNVD